MLRLLSRQKKDNKTMKRISNQIRHNILSAILVALACCLGAGRAAGQVLVWGKNANLQMNLPASATNVTALAAGDDHCLALRADGTVVAWGANSSGQINVPSDLTNAVSVAAGSTHSLALRRDGTVILWGKIMGSGITNVPPEATNVVALALGPGAQHALVLRADGTVFDWGKHVQSVPTWPPSDPVNPLTNIPPTVRNIVSVAAGAAHSLALRSDGQVVAWGYNTYGQTNVPADATNIVAIAAGWYGNAALRADGTMLVWGTNGPAPQFTDFTNVIDVACPFNPTSATGCGFDFFAG
jgi:alpha-tubulin suppressor-like RCC1 family protein